MTGSELTAEWVLIGKVPGSSSDYGVLATSDGGASLGSYVGVYVTGAPSSSAPTDTPGAPPWITFGAHATGPSQGMISVTVLDQWEGLDHASRPIWPRRLFLFRFDELAAAGASYRMLWEAVRLTSLPAPDRALRFIVPPQRIDDLCATIASRGFERLATLAAAMLEGPVGLTGAAHLTRDERLALLDAVSALLPYGFRADLSASSSVDNTVAHQIRLVFADFSNHQVLVPLNGSLPELRPGLARDYYELLLKKMHYSGPAAVVEYLWKARRPCSFDHPGEALKILHELNRHDQLVRDLLEGVETRAEVIRFFQDSAASVQATWNRPDMEPRLRDRLVSRLLEAPDQIAAELLSRHWGTVVDYVTRFVLRFLDQGDTSWASWCLKVAGTVPQGQAVDDLLAHLLMAGSTAGRQDALIRLLLERDVPQPNTFRFTCEELRWGPNGTGQPELVRHLLVREMARSSRGLHWTYWLCRSVFRDRQDRAAWATLLEAALTGSAADWEAGRSAMEHDPRWLPVVIWLARQADVLAALIGNAGFSLVRIALAIRAAEAAETAKDLLAALDVELWPLRVAPGPIAVTDVARVLFGGSPRDFPDHAPTQEIFDLYGEGMEKAFGHVPPGPMQANLQDRFLRHAVVTAPDTRQGDGAIWLLGLWSADPVRGPGLARYIVEHKIATALIRDERLDETFWTPLVGYEPSLKPFVAGLLLRTAMRDADRDPVTELRRVTGEDGSVPGTRLTLAMYGAHRAGMPIQAILEVMRDPSARGGQPIRIQPGELDAVLREFQGLMFHQPARNAPGHGPDPRQAAEDALLESYQLIADGALGRDFGQRFEADVRQRLGDDIKFRKRIRRTLKRRRPGRRSPEIAGPVADEPSVVPRQDPAQRRGQAGYEVATIPPSRQAVTQPAHEIRPARKPPLGTRALRATLMARKARKQAGANGSQRDSALIREQDDVSRT